MNYDSFIAAINGLTVFRGLMRREIFTALNGILLELNNENYKPLELISLWAEFVNAFLAFKGLNFSKIVQTCVLEDENIWTLSAERTRIKETIQINDPVTNPKIEQKLNGIADADIQKLNHLAKLDIAELADDIFKKAGKSFCADWIAEEGRTLQEHKDGENILNIQSIVSAIAQNGAGLLSRGTMFYWNPEHGICPASNGDTIKLSDMTGYEEQRGVVLSNTERFLLGKGANNMLLYGDRGTGKSATVKAAANEFAARGLRLVEVRKQDINELPAIMQALKERALRFVLFIDDLSFEDNEGRSAFKALLEGGIEVKPDNVVIYATSNRRHLVKEKTADRPSSSADVRSFDTIQEQLSLSDRFGVTVIYTSPSQDEYLKIACFIAENKGLLNGKKEDRAVFAANALRWERWFNGRSPRTANQYVDWVLGGGSFPWE